MTAYLPRHAKKQRMPRAVFLVLLALVAVVLLVAGVAGIGLLPLPVDAGFFSAGLWGFTVGCCAVAVWQERSRRP